MQLVDGLGRHVDLAMYSVEYFKEEIIGKEMQVWALLLLVHPGKVGLGRCWFGGVGRGVGLVRWVGLSRYQWRSGSQGGKACQMLMLGWIVGLGSVVLLLAFA